MNINLQKAFDKLKINRKSNSEKKGTIKELIAKISKGLMLPIALLPIAGLFLGIGAAIVTEAVNNKNQALETFGNFLKIPGDVIFGALPLLFAIGLAIAFTKDAGSAILSTVVGFLVFAGVQSALIIDKVEGYNVLFYMENNLLTNKASYGIDKSLVSNTLGIKQLNTSVVGGFIVGLTVAFLYNKYKNIKMPAVLGFFNGVRFIPIITFLAMFPIAIMILILWPLIGIGFYWMGDGLGRTYGVNSFIFGFIERSLVPTGLHHAFYSPLWYTEAGGTFDLTKNAQVLIDGSLQNIIISGGKTGTWNDLLNSFGNITNNDYIGNSGSISGDQKIWAFVNSNFIGRKVMLANGLEYTLQFKDFTTNYYVSADQASSIGLVGVNPGQYMQGKYTFMMFGLPAAGASMIMAAPKENRKMVASIIASASFTSFLTGITEPIEFTFLLLAPWLFWGFHAFMCALSFGLMNWVGLINPELGPHIGMTFSGGIIDWVVYGGIQIGYGSNAWWSLVFGLAYAPIYYFFFLWAIKKFNIETPGRGENTKLFNKQDYIVKKSGNNSNINENISMMAVNIIKAYGGLENIKNVDACITKLRVQVVDQSLVQDKVLTDDLGARGIIRPSKQSCYAIYGVDAEIYKNEMINLIKLVHDSPELKDQYFSDNNLLVDNTANKKAEKIEEKSTEKVKIYAPCKCKIVDIKNVPDETFSKKMMGDGIAIIPLESKFASVIKTGKLELVFPTGHAYSYVTSKDTKILVHIGIDSINLKDENEKELNLFKILKHTNDKVHLEDYVAEVKIKNLSKYARSNITPIIVLNESIKGRVIKFSVKENDVVEKGTVLFEIA